MPPLRSLVVRIASSRPGAWLFSRIGHRIDRPVLRWTGGKASLSSVLSGLPVMALTTTGARTGQARSTPLVGTPDGDNLILVASRWGQGGVPAWYHNLKAHPDCTVTLNGVTKRYRARETHGDERAACWRKAVAYYAGYAAYARRLGDHIIPVFILEPAKST
jgi:deazaflavin-dependent oxidoreductase (nitroreductase family)